VAAGLGGGSSNAATVLLGLNELFGFRLSQKALLGLGKRLGADVPFFLLKTPFAIGRKKGDQLTPFKTHLKFTHLIVNNRVKVSTQGVYQQANLGLTRKGGKVKIFQQFIKQHDDFKGVAKRCFNALETPAIARYPSILKVRQTLETLGVSGVTLSGSGPTFFGFAKNIREARAFRKAILSKHDWDVFICQTYSFIHPE